MMGKVFLKERIRKILSFKKPMFWVIGFIFLFIIIFAIGLLTNLEKIALPNPNAVQTIEMEQFNEGSSLGLVVIYNEDSIEAVVGALNGARKTMEISPNDYPVQSNYLVVRLNQEDERRTLYLYSENGDYYIEEPYVGIYKSNRSKSVEIYKIYTDNGIDKGDKRIGYISNFEASNGTRITFDPIEWITLDDDDRIKELEIDDFDMPNGYYIYNSEVEQIEYKIDEHTEYIFIDWGHNFATSDEDRFHYSTKNKKEFIEYLNTYTDKAAKVPFWVIIKDGVVLTIEEQYVP